MTSHNVWAGAVLSALLSIPPTPVMAAVTETEAARLKTDLTPMGAERAGNKDGSIPPWTGGMSAPPAGYVVTGRRADPFAADKPFASITAKNMADYAEALTEGSKALLKKYPQTFRIDVYPSRRTAAAPSWVYDNIAKNATRATLVQSSSGPVPSGAYGGVPFPIPKTGVEAMWNHVLHWRGEAWHVEFNGYQSTTDGHWINVVDSANDHMSPYYAKEAPGPNYNGDYYLAYSINAGPPIRAGEAIVARLNIDQDKTVSWVYLTGQRRVRKLPNPCCDTPTPFSAGLITFDEIDTFTGRLDRFDWTIVGKKEMFIPYNSNRTMVPTKDAEILGPGHLNPDHVRWERHRVWVVEATLKPGQRHVSPKSRYYLDEDTWQAVIGERYDASGVLARVPFFLPMVMPEVPENYPGTQGVYDLIAGTSFINFVFNEKKLAFTMKPRFKDSVFTPDAMAGEGVR